MSVSSFKWLMKNTDLSGMKEPLALNMEVFIRKIIHYYLFLKDLKWTLFDLFMYK
ncbi:hypothetical protein WSS15_30870 [Acetobacter pasteurianus]|nr:hypothetical protein WSS15_30870 [Acetobacter pasteurianus]